MFANVTSLPLVLIRRMVGRRSLPPRCLVSSTTVRGQARHFVELRGDREAVHEVVELDHARHFGDDRVGVRIPGRRDLAARHRVAFLDADHRAVRNLVALALATELVHHADLARAGHGHQVPLLVLDGLDVMEADRALVAHFDARGRRRSRRRATDVERAHRELRARLADRLRGDDTHRLADRDRTTAAEIASVARRAHAVARVARDGRTHLQLVHAFALDEPHELLIQQRVLLDRALSSVPGFRMASASVRPSTRSPSASTTSPPSTSGAIVEAVRPCRNRAR